MSKYLSGLLLGVAWLGGSLVFDVELADLVLDLLHALLVGVDAVYLQRESVLANLEDSYHIMMVILFQYNNY